MSVDGGSYLLTCRDRRRRFVQISLTQQPQVGKFVTMFVYNLINMVCKLLPEALFPLARIFLVLFSPALTVGKTSEFDLQSVIILVLKIGIALLEILGVRHG